MSYTEIAGLVGTFLLVGVIVLFLRATIKWGKETKKREEAAAKQPNMTLLAEDGSPLECIQSDIIDG